MLSNNYCTLDRQQVARVHEASLEVLQTTGIRVSHALALEKLAARGDRYDGRQHERQNEESSIHRRLLSAPTGAPPQRKTNPLSGLQGTVRAGFSGKGRTPERNELVWSSRWPD